MSLCCWAQILGRFKSSTAEKKPLGATTRAEQSVLIQMQLALKVLHIHTPTPRLASNCSKPTVGRRASHRRVFLPSGGYDLAGEFVDLCRMRALLLLSFVSMSFRSRTSPTRQSPGNLTRSGHGGACRSSLSR